MKNKLNVINVISSINYSSNDSDAAVLTNEINCTASPDSLRQIAAQARVIGSAASVELWVQSAAGSDVYVNVDSEEQRELYAQRYQYHATRRRCCGEIGEGLIERAKKMLASHTRALSEHTKFIFVRYMGGAHINSMNIALYAARGGACEARAENVPSIEVFWVRRFESTAAAEEWYRAQDGVGVEKLLNAINSGIERV